MFARLRLQAPAQPKMVEKPMAISAMGKVILP